ncbi:MAG: TonB-dependent receptor [Bacteroidota bacterium]
MKKNKVNAYKLAFGIKQFHFKTDFNYYINTTHGLDFGVSTIRYNLQPGSFTPVGEESLVAPDIIPDEQAMESALYISHRYTVSPKFTINSGIRYSIFNYLGPQEINLYTPGLPMTATNQTGVKEYKKGKFINTYHGPEYRLSLRYSITNSFSIKASYNSLRQYIHMLSNTTSIAPTDIWKLSDPNIKPQHGQQVSLGLYKNFKENTIETSVEVYYKKIKDYLDYKPGARLIMNHDIETDVMSTKGKAYGVEVMIKKQEGKLNGWIGYTWSRIFLKSDNAAMGAIVNHGEYYPANYDKPHDVTHRGQFQDQSPVQFIS